jgi:hypothetical protein
MKNVRQLHLFFGTFFAPLIIFFAFSGILQLFGLHESKGKDGPPPIAWIAQMGEIHKNQHLRAEARPHKDEHDAGEHDAHDDVHPTSTHTHADAPPSSASSSWALKAFVLLMAIGLICTSLIGIYIAVQNPRSRRNAWISLALGIAVPLLLVLL